MQTTGSNTGSQEGQLGFGFGVSEPVDEWLANPGHYADELVELLDELDYSAPEDRRYDESTREEIGLAVEALNRTMEHAVSGDNDDDERTTMTTNDKLWLMYEVERELRTHFDETPHRDAEMVNEWVSYADDPWTSARDLAHKTAQEMALEGRPWNTDAGTGWWGEISPSGFGVYSPTAGMVGEATCDSSDADPADDYSAASTIGVLLQADGTWAEMAADKLAEAREAVGMRPNGGWYRAPLEGIYTGPPSSMTPEEAEAEFGSYETAGEASHRFDSFDQTIDALMAAPATYRAQN